SEISIGIVCAGIVLALTDFGGARRRLAAQVVAISSEITRRYAGTLTVAGAGLDDTQPVRRELARRVIALDPAIDEAVGESSYLRYYSTVLQTAVDGLLAALASWRSVAAHLPSLTPDRARQEAQVVLREVPEELRSAPEHHDPQSKGPMDPSRWVSDPAGLKRFCDAAVRRLLALPTATPSLRLLADQTAEMLAGVSRTLDGLALLVDDPARPVARSHGGRHLRIPDLLPALVAGGRALVVIGAAELFWIGTGWPNGAQAVTWATIGVILFASRADQAYATAVGFMVGTCLTAALAAIVAFAVLPNLATFAAFGLAIGLVLVPAGAGMAQPWQTAMFTAMAAYFVPLLGPANQESYDTQQFYNAASAIVIGLGAATFSFRLLPPLSPAFRTHRLLRLTLRDLRRLATGPIPRRPDDWEGTVFGRLSVLPDEAEPLQRAQLLAALFVGTEIIELRRISRRDLEPQLEAALKAVAHGESAMATAKLADLDEMLASRPGAAALRGRSLILAISESLTQHSSYFDAGAPA
ncbi:MAG TPA: FUSC family protein, partial [Stellaceae bacterium]|nr:FUSC family protein [Stellaceae bacterium]